MCLETLNRDKRSGNCQRFHVQAGERQRLDGEKRSRTLRRTFFREVTTHTSEIFKF